MRANSLTDAQRQYFSELVSEGEILSPVEFQRRMGWSAEDVKLAELARRVFALESDNVKAYPAFYSDPRYAREQLEAITVALGDLSGGSKWVFFTTPKGSLATPGRVTKDGREQGTPRTPLQALAQGDFELTRRSALAYAER
jgi:hypothetical protein